MEEEVKKAGRKPKEKVESTTTDEVKVVENKVDETDKLKAENSAMAEMLKQMQEQMDKLQAQMSYQPQVFVTNESNSDSTRTILVTGTLPFTQAITTEPFGRGRAYVFEGLYETKPIPFTDMQKIVITCEEMLKDGRILLKNQKDYEDLQIGYVYDLVPTLDSIKELAELKTSESVDVLLSLSREMQEGIIALIATNIVNGKSYDYNIIKELKDEGIDIDKYVETLKEIKEEDEE